MKMELGGGLQARPPSWSNPVCGHPTVEGSLSVQVQVLQIQVLQVQVLQVQVLQVQVLQVQVLQVQVLQVQVL